MKTFDNFICEDIYIYPGDNDILVAGDKKDLGALYIALVKDRRDWLGGPEECYDPKTGEPLKKWGNEKQQLKKAYSKLGRETIASPEFTGSDGGGLETVTCYFDKDDEKMNGGEPVLVIDDNHSGSDTPDALRTINDARKTLRKVKMHISAKRRKPGAFDPLAKEKVESGDEDKVSDKKKTADPRELINRMRKMGAAPDLASRIAKKKGMKVWETDKGEEIPDWWKYDQWGNGAE